jgi:hypothetical protein
MEVNPLGSLRFPDKLVHPLKALSPMEVTPFGMMILVRLMHPLKALPPMELIPFGSVTLFRLLQLLNIP